MLHKLLPVLLLTAMAAPAQALEPVRSYLPETSQMACCKHMSCEMQCGNLVRRMDNTVSWDQPQAKKAVSGPRPVNSYAVETEKQAVMASNWAFMGYKQAPLQQAEKPARQAACCLSASMACCKDMHDRT